MKKIYWNNFFEKKKIIEEKNKAFSYQIVFYLNKDIQKMISDYDIQFGN